MALNDWKPRMGRQSSFNFDRPIRGSCFFSESVGEAPMAMLDRRIRGWEFPASQERERLELRPRIVVRTLFQVRNSSRSRSWLAELKSCYSPTGTAVFS